MLTNPKNLWYTDTFSVYREEEYTEGNLTKQRRIPVSKDVPGRVYRSSSHPTTMTTTAAEISQSDMLACAVEVDIEEGDEIIVIRGAKLNKGKGPTTTYFAGESQDYYEPFGGVIPGLRHKQVLLGGDRKLKKSSQSNIVE